MIRTPAWALLALLMSARVLAGVTFLNTEFYIRKGVPFTIKWSGNQGPVSVAVMNGPDENLQEVLVIVADYAGQDYTWTPPASLPADSYELRLQDAGSTDYSSRFQYPAPPPDTTSSSSEATPTNPASSPQPTSTSPSTSTTQAPAAAQPPLSTAAIAVIATLGGLLLVALLALLICHLSRRRRRRRKRREDGDTADAAAAAAAMGGGGGGHHHQQQQHNMPPGSAVGSDAYNSGASYYTHGSPDTAVAGSAVGGAGAGGGGAAAHMKVFGPGEGGYYWVGQGQVPEQQGRSELGSDEMVELSAQGRYLR